MTHTKSRNWLSAVVSVALSSLAMLLGSVQTAQAFTPVGTLSPMTLPNNPGNLRAYQYARVSPWPTPVQQKPVVVALHGCGQTAAQYAEESGWMEIAEERGFHLLLAEQKWTNNLGSCFNWFEPGDIERGQGEAASIAAMVSVLVDADPALQSHGPRIYVTGLSAGAAMSAVMIATYPDVFTGAGINAGVPYKCAADASPWTRLMVAQACMNGAPSTKTAKEWGDLARSGYPGYPDTFRRPRVIIFQGTADTTVTPPRMTELMQQWTNFNHVVSSPTTTSTLKGYPTNAYTTVEFDYTDAELRDANDTYIDDTHRRRETTDGDRIYPVPYGGYAGLHVQTVSITGMDHAVAVEPGPNAPIPTTIADQCGKLGTYAINPATGTQQGLCSSYYTALFWGI